MFFVCHGKCVPCKIYNPKNLNSSLIYQYIPLWLRFRGCGFDDRCSMEEICYDTNKTLGEVECMTMSKQLRWFTDTMITSSMYIITLENKNNMFTQFRRCTSVLQIQWSSSPLSWLLCKNGFIGQRNLKGIKSLWKIFSSNWQVLWRR